MTDSINNLTEKLAANIDAMTGFECFDFADKFDTASMYATGADKVITQFTTGDAVDTDKLQTMIQGDLNSRYPVADCPDGSDMQKKFKRVKEAYQRRASKAFPVTGEDKKVTYNGKIDITFNVTGKKDKPETRKRTVKVELLTAVQVEVLEKQKTEKTELAEKQKKEKKELAEKQKMDSLATASVPEQLKALQQFMAETFGLKNERAVVAAWMADLNDELPETVGDTGTVDLTPLLQVNS